MDAFALAIAAALLVLGVAAIAVRRSRLGLAAVVVGLSLPTLVYLGEIRASALVAPVAAAMAPLLAPVIGTGIAHRGTAATLSGIALAAGVVAGPVSTLLYDPFYDRTCFTDCAPNPLAIAHLDVGVHDTLWFAAFVAAVSLTLLAFRGPGRAAFAGLATASWVLALWRDHLLLAGIATGLVALTLTGLAVSRAFEARARMAELARALELAGDIETTLAKATRDPQLTVTYVLDDGTEVRTDGSLAGSGPAPDPLDVRVTDLVGPDGVVARVHHRAQGADTARLATAVRGPGRLALENGHLAVQVRRKAAELKASRRRIVAHADAERRRLERDLHDSAQQHVLALGLSLRTALDQTDDEGMRDVLQRGLASTYEVLDELRELSHGFYPASLEQTGLRNALDGLVDRAPFPVAVVAVPSDRLPAPVERAVYLLVARATVSARRPMAVGIRREDGRVTVDISGAPVPDGVLPDIFAVLDGSLDSVPGDAGPGLHGVLRIEPAGEDA